MLYAGFAGFLFFLRYALARQVAARQLVYFLVLTGLFLFSAFRYQVGCDWSGYYFQYLAAAGLDWSDLFTIREPLWWAIFLLIHNAGFPYPVVNVVASALFFLGIHFLARRQPDPLAVLVLLFPILIVNMPMSGIKQGVAIGFVCIAFVAFLDRRPFWFTFWVLIAAGFHSSALIFVLLLPVVTDLHTRARLWVAALFALPGIYLLTSTDAAELAITSYVDTGMDSEGAVFRVGVLTLSGLFFLFFIRRKWKLVWPKDYNLVHIGSIGMLITIFLVPYSTVIADRLAYYLIPIQALIFARLPFMRFRRNAALYAALPYFGLLLVLVVWTQASGHFQECYLPYQTWIFGFPDGDPVGL